MPELKDLIEGSLRREQKCKEMIYKSFYGYLMAIALRYTANRDDAEELVNDSFMKIFRGLEKFKIEKTGKELELLFRGWIGTITTRTAIDFLRSRRTFTSIEELSVADEPAIVPNAPGEMGAKEILSLLNALPETQRIIFNMYEIEGFSHAEISKMLNLTESASRVYLTRAKTKLRELYIKNFNHAYAG